MLEECNWVQGLEGDIDSSHIDWVHARLDPEGGGAAGAPRYLQPRSAAALRSARDRVRRLLLGSRVWDDDGTRWHRVTQLLMPFHTMIAASGRLGPPAQLGADRRRAPYAVLADRLAGSRPPSEERARHDEPFTQIGGYLPRTQQSADALSVRGAAGERIQPRDELQQEELMFGVPFIGNLQDRAMTEPMGPIYERWNEHLGTTDAMVIFVRRRLLEAARALREHGCSPANVSDPALNRVRSASALLPGRRELGDGHRRSAKVRLHRASGLGAARRVAALT